MQEAELPFEDLPPPKPPARAVGALRLVAEGAKPLSVRQRQFNRLVSRIESLRKDIAKHRTQMDTLLAEYLAHVHPLRTEEHRVRRALVRVLAEIWRKPGGLGKRQRANLRDLLRAQFSLMEEHEPGPEDDDLLVLADELERDAAENEQTRNPRPEGPEENGWLDDDADGPGYPGGSGGRVGLSAEDILRDFMERFAGGQGADGPSTADAPPPTRKRTAAQKRREQREAELEEARKRGVSVIYKQLAKVLHPDLERDPVRRAEKMKLMQQLTEAHRAGDLHTLLRLELEFIHGEERRSWELGEEKLALYCDLLKEQVAELEDEKRRVDSDPRYSVFAARFWPYRPRQTDLVKWGKELRAVIDSLEASRVRLDGPEAKAEVRGALEAFAAEKRRRRWVPALDGLF